MQSVIGVDARVFERESVKSNGDKGNFKSVLGIAVKVKDYYIYNKQYKRAIETAFSITKKEIDYQYYCVNDMRDWADRYTILDAFAKEISASIEKIHIFYTLFSKKRIPEVKVYGRMAQQAKIKLSQPTRTYEQLIDQHVTNIFPMICSWKLMEYLSPNTVEFHMDSYNGHICEAQEEMTRSSFKQYVYPSGDCSNPVISTADLLLDLLDKRLEMQRRFLLFDNIRPALPEFGNNLLVYPILSKHLPYITPIEKKPINTMQYIRHPVFWLFKGEELMNSSILKRSKTYRNLIDYAANLHGVVKMFEKSKDIDYVSDGDYGVYLNDRGKDIIDSYEKIGIKFKPLKLDIMVPESFET